VCVPRAVFGSSWHNAQIAYGRTRLKTHPTKVGCTMRPAPYKSRVRNRPPPPGTSRFKPEHLLSNLEYDDLFVHRLLECGTERLLGRLRVCVHNCIEICIQEHKIVDQSCD
jgi:hypothetical protein